MDFFLWGFLKSLLHANKPMTAQTLKAEIERYIYRDNIAKQLLKISQKTIPVPPHN